MEKYAYILVDFDNFFKNPIEKLVSEEIEYTLSDILKIVIKKNSKIERVFIRLYGGWYSKDILTKKASEIQQTLSHISVFPFFNKKENIIVRGQIELVSSAISMPYFRWGNLYQERNGIPRLRIDSNKTNTTCISNKNNCPIYILNTFTKNKTKICNVESCENKNADVFLIREQKMVDTLIACDLIHCGNDDSVLEVLLISNDTDHFPAIVIGNSNSKKHKFSLLLTNSYIFSEYEDLFETNNIKLVRYEL